MQRVKCFMIRHQAEGVIHETVYASPPSAEVVAEVCASLEHRHGKVHPDLKEPYWTRIHESVLEVPDEIAHAFEAAPEPAPKPERDGTGEPGSGNVGISAPRVSGTGTVTNPGE